MQMHMSSCQGDDINKKITEEDLDLDLNRILSQGRSLDPQGNVNPGKAWKKNWIRSAIPY